MLYYATSGAEEVDWRAGEIKPTLVCGPVQHQHARRNRQAATPGEIKQRFPDLLVVMVTAYGDDEGRRQVSVNAAAEFFTKPVDFDHLKARLRRLPCAPD
jgi:DNA-binding NtrC family response regulator